jgi:phosphate transport system ATP-binding protein
VNPVQDSDLQIPAEPPLLVEPETNGDGPPRPSAGAMIVCESVTKVYEPDVVALRDISFHIDKGEFVFIVGASGSGKSTLIRTINRLHEVVPGARHEGEVLLDGTDVYAPGTDPVEIRRRVGMVFQRPNPFPTMSIYDNVAAGLKLNGIRGRRSELDDLVRESLEGAGLWNEVKGRLRDPAGKLSGGQQQRLCIARAIAVRPDVLLMDEPASALDPQSTLRIEDLVGELKADYTIVIVTHNMQQAARVADCTAFLTVLDEGAPGTLVEFGPTNTIFTNPTEQRTEDYVTGRFG